jgi:hypothetical protein
MVFRSYMGGKEAIVARDRASPERDGQTSLDKLSSRELSFEDLI